MRRLTSATPSSDFWLILVLVPGSSDNFEWRRYGSLANLDFGKLANSAQPVCFEKSRVSQRSTVGDSKEQVLLDDCLATRGSLHLTTHE